MSCPVPIRIFDKKSGKTRYVPCGHCLQCRIDKRNEWTWRMSHELEDKDGVFLTLTIDDEHLVSRSVYPRSVQLFLKRLRKRLGDRRIKYIFVGEYGSIDQRPHYHAIISGLSCGRYMTFDRGDYDVIRSSWSYGYISMSPATTANIRYTLKYLDKQLSDDEWNEKYPGLNKPFRLVSKGIGRAWLVRNLFKVQSDRGFFVRGKLRPLPRYYNDMIFGSTHALPSFVTNRKKYGKILKYSEQTNKPFYVSALALGNQNLIDLERKTSENLPFLS